jgi:hypothetical protein
MTKYNDVRTIVRWVDRAANESSLNNEQREECREIGRNLAERRLWRGDISEAWRARFPWINGSHIDFYP